MTTQIDSVFNKNDEEIAYIFELKTARTFKDLSVIMHSIDKHVPKLNSKIKELENDPEYRDVKFYDALNEFIRIHFTDFKQKYPDFYLKIVGDTRKTQQFKERIESMRKMSEHLGTVDKIIRNYILMGQDLNLALAEMDELDQGSHEKSIDDQIADKKKEIESKAAEETELRKKLDENPCKRDNEYRKLPIDDLQLKKREIGWKCADFETNISRLTSEASGAQKALEVKSKQKEPEFYKNRKMINEMFASINRILPNVRDCRNITDCLKMGKNLDKNEDIKIAKKIGKYFGPVQDNIFFPGKGLIKIKEIDFINKAYILADGSSYVFMMNPGAVLVNTLLGRIRNLPENKKSVLLIDEVSPLEDDSMDLLYKELSKQIKEKRILLAVISRPKKHPDSDPHIYEVPINV